MMVMMDQGQHTAGAHNKRDTRTLVSAAVFGDGALLDRRDVR